VRRFVRVHSWERGAAGLLTVLFLPALVGSLLAVVALGQTILARHLVTHAADLGALAGVQALDLDTLAQGRMVLIPEEARARSREYVMYNLSLTFPEAGPEATIETEVIDPEGSVRRDPVTGRVHEWPTVCVLVSMRIPIGVGPFRGYADIQAHADASVVPR